MTTPRVLMLIKALDTYAGSAGQLRQLAGRFKTMNVPCRVVAQERGTPNPDVALAGVEVVRLPARRSRDFYRAVESFLIENAATYDVIHIHGHGTLSLVAARAAKKVGGKPVLIKVTAAGDKSRLRTWEIMARWLPFMKRRLAGHATAWIALSQETQRGLEHIGVAPERIFAIPNGVDETFFCPASLEEKAALKESFGIEENVPVAISIGSLKWRKRMDRTIEAFGRAYEQAGRGHLWIIGDGPDRAVLEALAANGPARDAITFLGHQDRAAVAARLRAADLFVLPSVLEGLANVVLEAMSCGLPVIVSHLSGNEDLIRSEENGILVAPGDEESLLQALLSLLNDPAKAARLGMTARQTILDGYSLDSVARRLEELYGKLVAGEVR